MTDCPSGKIRYPTRAWALRIAERCGWKRSRAYDCRECGGAHLTRETLARRGWLPRRLGRERRELIESEGDYGE